VQGKSPKRHEGKFGHISNLRWLSKESPENANHLTNNINKSHYTNNSFTIFFLILLPSHPPYKLFPLVQMNDSTYLIIYGETARGEQYSAHYAWTHTQFLALWVHTLHSTLLTTRVGGADTPPCNLNSNLLIPDSQSFISYCSFPHKLPLSHKHRSQANMPTPTKACNGRCRAQCGVVVLRLYLECNAMYLPWTLDKHLSID